MKKSPSIVTCGDSLIIEGLTAQLRAKLDIDVIQIKRPLSAATKTLEECAPAVVIFDFQPTPGAPFDVCDLKFLEAHPGVLLIGVNAGTSMILTMCNQAHVIHKTRDLLSFIHKKITDTPDLF
ncbi:MAG: hypothetical protein ACLFTI_09515 [Anaerolineales bacterium]